MNRVHANDETWGLLLESIDDGECIPLLGAGVSTDNIPLGGKLVDLLKGRFGNPPRCVQNLSDMAAWIEQREPGGYGRGQLIDGLREVFGAGSHLNEVQKRLASLPWRTVLTTNYDDLMYWAFDFHLKRPRPYVLTERSWRDESFPYIEPGSVESPLIIHLHGRLKIAARDGIVITEADYYDFLSNISRGAIGLPHDCYRSLYRAHYLILGCSLRDWNVRLAFYALKKLLNLDQDFPRARQHFILVHPDETQGMSESEVSACINFKLKSLSRFVDAEVFYGNATDFSAELLERWSQRIHE